MFNEWRAGEGLADLPVEAGECSLSDLGDGVTAYRHLLPPSVSDRRATTFALGRAAAHRGASRLGLPGFELAIGEQGLPAWPDGMTGSIAHTNDVGVALVASRRAAVTVGLDVEVLSDVGEIEHLVARGPESDWIRKGNRHRRTVELFSAKEAVFKAFFPTLRVRFGFHDVVLTPRPSGDGFEGRFVDIDVPETFTVWSGWVGERVLTWLIRENRDRGHPDLAPVSNSHTKSNPK